MSPDPPSEDSPAMSCPPESEGGTSSEAASSPEVWAGDAQQAFQTWNDRHAKLDASVPGKVTDLKSMNLDGVDLDQALTKEFLLRREENFIPRPNKPVFKHPMNDFEYESVLEAIRDNWLQNGCQSND